MKKRSLPLKSRFAAAVIYVVAMLVTPRSQAQPVVSSISPAAGYVGSSVTINGSGFNTITANNAVYFGATKAVIAIASASSLTVNVPPGSTYAPLSVTNSATSLTGYSPNPFLQTYDNSSYVPGLINFQPHVDFTTGELPEGIATGDIDGDGKPDIVVVNSWSGTLSVFRNTSTAGTIDNSSFAAKVDFATYGSPYDLVIMDMDGDGKLDVVVRGDSGFSVFRNTAAPGTINSGSLAAPVNFSTSNPGSKLAVGDIDGDGKPEVVSTFVSTLSNPNNGFDIRQNTSTPGTISFSSATFFSITDSIAPIGVAMGDMNGDGKKDIVVASSSTLLYCLVVYQNAATLGTIDNTSLLAAVRVTTPYVTWGINAVDWDGDGKNDIIATSPQFGALIAVHNISTSGPLTESSFEPGSFVYGSLASPDFLSFGDFDGDAKPDLIVGDFSSAVPVARNIATPGTLDWTSFGYAGPFAVASGLPYGNTQGMAVCDFDGDGKPDIVSANINTANISVLRNNPLSPITGNTNVCVGSTTTLSNVMPGGTWSSSDNFYAPVGSSSGIVTGLLQGSVVITYTLPAAQGGKVTTTVTVLPKPAPIDGYAYVCPGAHITLEDFTTGGTWTSANTGIATIGSSSGIVTGVAAGITNITYTGPNGCAISTSVTVMSPPGTITGNAIMCAGGGLTLSNSSPGGTWSSANTAVVWFPTNMLGNCKAQGAGTTTITYTTCGSTTVTATVTPSFVAVLPSPGEICVGSSSTFKTYANTTYINTVTNVPYTSYAAGGATILASDDGSVSAALPFTFTLFGVNYSTVYINANGFVSFGSATSLGNYTAVALPSVNAPINGSPQAMIALFWHDMNSTSVGTITKATLGAAPNRKFIISYNGVGDYSGTGTNTGQIILYEGSNIIDLMIGNTGGGSTSYNKTCGIQNASGTVGIAATGENASNYTITNTGWRFYGVPGGSNTYAWTPAATLSNTAIQNPVATPAATGTATYSVTISAPGCVMKGSAGVVVDAYPTSISGNSAVCVTAVTTLTGSPSGGTWSSSNTSVATVGSSSGVVTGVTVGTTTITYTTGAGCYITRTETVQTTANPGTISGPVSVIVGTSATFTETVSGGVWTSESSAIATVGSSTGLVTGISTGLVYISYTVTNSCGAASTRKAVRVPLSRSGDGSVQASEATGSIALYPNPSNGVFFMATHVRGVLSVYTVDGKEVQQYMVPEGTSSHSLPTGLATGIYLCRFRGDDGETAVFRLTYQP